MGALTDSHAGVVELRGRATSRASAGKKERRGRSGGAVKEAVQRLAPSSNELAAVGFREYEFSPSFLPSHHPCLLPLTPHVIKPRRVARIVRVNYELGLPLPTEDELRAWERPNEHTCSE